MKVNTVNKKKKIWSYSLYIWSLEVILDTFEEYEEYNYTWMPLLAGRTLSAHGVPL